MQTIAGALLYAGTTVVSYWFPVAGFIVIFASQVLWIIVSIGEDETLP